jgi:hypothetical protein
MKPVGAVEHRRHRHDVAQAQRMHAGDADGAMCGRDAQGDPRVAM